ncbi:MAG: redoxin family protein [Isosphaeraceae bacterium]
MRGPRLFLPLLVVLFGLWALGDGPACTVTAADQPAGRAAISGKVVDGSAGPVAEARIALFRIDLVGSHWGGYRLLGKPAESDLAGKYQLDGLEDGYYMISVEKDGFARALHPANIESQRLQQVDITLHPPASIVVHVADRDGKPVAGARLRELITRGVNGQKKMRQLWLKTLGIPRPISDGKGELRLPPLPAGEMVKAIIEHPRLAPVEAQEIAAAPGASTRVTMQPGVALTLHVPKDPASGRITSAITDIRHEPWDDASTIIDYEVEFDSHGIGHLTVAPGEHSWFLLWHPEYYITPVYSANHFKKTWLRIEPGRNQDLHLAVRRKVKARGRVVSAETQKPLPGMSIMGELAHGTLNGWDDRPPEPWSFAGWGETNPDGEYTIELAPGKARLTFHGEKNISEQEEYEVSISPDGSTVLPDIRVRPLPKVEGVVQNPDGTPAARAIVRLRGVYLRGLQPVLTDAAGRFVIQPEYMPTDPATGRRAPAQQIAAFDPYRPLAARAEVRLDHPSKVVLKLETHDPGWQLSSVFGDFTERERGIVAPEEAAKEKAITLRGLTPPELDAAAWINTDGRTLKLADLRGKYVLLDFWFVGCGPCHGDFPSVKLVHQLYKDKGVVVIGVHNNSSPPEVVKEHVAKIGLPFPVAVDHPDGRTIARFEKHGIPDGYPDYVLISPEGKVLLDDRTIQSPALVAFKLEIIRRFLLESPPKGH